MKSERIFTYTAVFEPAQEGGYVVSVPALPGCLTQGETFEEAKKNVQEAISLYLSVLKEDGDEIPEESREHVVASVTATMPV
jgi:predicted RNase H-like HicB family nuclease